MVGFRLPIYVLGLYALVAVPVSPSDEMTLRRASTH